jgi:hypothetical protein
MMKDERGSGKQEEGRWQKVAVAKLAILLFAR